MIRFSGLMCLAGLIGAATVDVDVTADRRAIDPRIYGIAYGTATTLDDLNAPLNRLGGNNTSRYNWQQNADNRGSDWYFQSVPFSSATPGAEVDSFIQASRDGGAEPLITVPMIGWVAKLGAGRTKLASFSIAKYGAQTGNDWEWFPDAGNGVLASGGNVVNDKNDANVPNSTALQQSWVQHLIARWGLSAAGGQKWYILDNEYSIWQGTHRDVQPTGATMGEIRDAMVAYSTMIKSQDPGALVVGPEEWGWSGYLYSGYDQQYAAAHGWSSFPDRSANGNADYLPWLLAQLRTASIAAGKRLLDVFSVHYYPQGGEFSEDVSAAMQARRNRSTRSLWDPDYTDETWINDKIRLIPRLKQWVAANYADTPVAITEYNWGAENHINGATTQADIYGIFGREGLDIATRWTTPLATTPTYKAMKLFRNYDGAKSCFGNTSVRATVANPDNLSAFAAERASDGALTVMVINKTTSASATTVNLAHFSPGTAAQVWQLTSANTINHLADAAVAGGAVSLTVPAQSVTLLVIPPGAPPAPLPTVTITASDAAAAEVANPGGFTVTRTGATTASLVVNLTAGGTAGNGSDHTSIGGSVTIPAGSASVAVAVTVTNDTQHEGPETVIRTIAANAAYTIGSPASATVTIADDDALAVSGAGTPAPATPQAGTPVTVTLPLNTPHAVNVQWTWGDGTAVQAGNASATHTYAASGTYTVSVQVTDPTTTATTTSSFTLTVAAASPPTGSTGGTGSSQASNGSGESGSCGGGALAALLLGIMAGWGITYRR